MLRTLESFGFEWDGEVVRQSARLELYAGALRALQARALTYECSCSRRERHAGLEIGYPGTCRQGPRRTGVPTATRLRVAHRGHVEWQDRIQGSCRFGLDALGDVILRRKDGLFAYQLAVVVDDAAQQVSDVVRGADLLESTAWQRVLQEDLGYPTPRYAHIPLLTESSGAKLAKSRRSLPVDALQAGPELFRVLALLRQAPPPDLVHEPPRRVLDWACRHWHPEALAGLRTVALD